MSGNQVVTQAEAAQKWSGGEISQRFLCKWQKCLRASGEQSHVEICILELGIVLSHLESSSSELLPSSHHTY